MNLFFIWLTLMWNAEDEDIAAKIYLLEVMEKEKHNVVTKTDDEKTIAALTKKEVMHEFFILLKRGNGFL